LAARFIASMNIEADSVRIISENQASTTYIK